MRACCVVGGAGFIGAHLVRQLQRAGWLPVVFDRWVPPADQLVPGVRYVQGDYGDLARLESVLAAVEAVVDLAYATVPKSSFEDPIRDIMQNLPPSVGLLQLASRLPLRKIVLMSSGGTVYGHAREIPIPERHPTSPLSPYGITKLALEKYGLMFHELERLPVMIARPANAYGEGQRPFSGQGFVATAMASVLLDREILLFGEQGTIRDYLHVEDLARGIVAILEQGVPGAAYNIGSGSGLSNRDVLRDIAALASGCGLRLKIKVEPPRRFDVPVNVLDSTLLRELTGWKPLIPWAEGLARAWAWLRSRPLAGSAG